MTLRITSIEDADKKLTVIKEQNGIIKLIFEIYVKKYPSLSKDGVCQLIAEKSGISRATVWRIIEKGDLENKSVYEKGGIKSL